MHELRECFRLWNVRHWDVVSNERTQAVTLRYIPAGQEEEVVLRTDQQARLSDNLRVLFLVVNSIRMNEKRGIGDVVREAYVQLAAPKVIRDPYEVLGVRPDCDRVLIESAYKTLAKVRHPDHGGSVEAMAERNEAYQQLTDTKEPS